MNEQIKKMAELLKSGATMLQDTCPVCNSPLFKFEGKTFCVKCGTSPAGGAKVTSRPDNVGSALIRMNSTVLKRIDELEIEIAKTTDLDKLSEFAKLTLVFLNILRLLEELGEKKSAKVE
jgi:UPF0148 protein